MSIPNFNPSQACYYVSPSGAGNLITGIKAAVSCGLSTDGARLAVTLSQTDFNLVKTAIGFQEGNSGTGRLWLG